MTSWFLIFFSFIWSQFYELIILIVYIKITSLILIVSNCLFIFGCFVHNLAFQVVYKIIKLWSRAKKFIFFTLHGQGLPCRLIPWSWQLPFGCLNALKLFFGSGNFTDIKVIIECCSALMLFSIGINKIYILEQMLIDQY